MRDLAFVGASHVESAAIMITSLAVIFVAFILGGAVIVVVGAADAKIMSEERLKRLRQEQEERFAAQQIKLKKMFERKAEMATKESEKCAQCQAKPGVQYKDMPEPAECWQCKKVVSRVLDLHHTSAALCSVVCERDYWIDIYFN